MRGTPSAAAMGEISTAPPSPLLSVRSGVPSGCASAPPLQFPLLRGTAALGSPYRPPASSASLIVTLSTPSRGLSVTLHSTSTRPLYRSPSEISMCSTAPSLR